MHNYLGRKIVSLGKTLECSVYKSKQSLTFVITAFSAIKRADSSASTKRKVSSISASDTSDHETGQEAGATGSSPVPEESPGVFTEEKYVYESHLFDLPGKYRK